MKERLFYKREVDWFGEFEDYTESADNQRLRLDKLNSLARPDLVYNLHFGMLGCFHLGNDWRPLSATATGMFYIRRLVVNGVNVIYNQVRHGVSLSLKPGNYDFEVEYVIRKYYVADPMERFDSSPYYSEDGILKLNVDIDDHTDYHLLLQIILYAKYRKYNSLSKYLFDGWVKDISLKLANKDSIDEFCHYYDASIYAHHYELNRHYGKIMPRSRSELKEDSNMYEKHIGIYVNGEKNGQGYTFYPNGNVYYGTWRNNNTAGYGVTYFADKSYLYGYRDLYYQGEMLRFYPNGEMEVFYVEQDMAQNLSVLFTKQNGGFLRYYKDNQLIGNGEPLSPNGNTISRDTVTAVKVKKYVNKIQTKHGIYSGEVYDGIPHGVGVMEYEGGVYYLGSFNRGIREGVGTYHFANGDYVFCQFKKGLKHGQGRMFFKDGRVEDVYYENDLPIRKYEFDHKNLYPLQMLVSKTTKIENQPKNSTDSSIPNVNKKASISSNNTVSTSTSTSTQPTSNVQTKTFINGYYEGELNDKNQFHGKGKYKWYSGDKYVGDWKNNKRDGKGVYYYKNGDRFEGQYVDGKREGQGIYYYKDGTKLVGTWKNDTYVDKNKSASKAVEPTPVKKVEPLMKHNYTFANAKKSEYDSVLTLADCKYVGRVKNGKPHLAGTYYYNDGKIYSGIVFDGIKENYGTWIYSNGEYYQGEIINGKREGFGIQHYQDGSVYVGIWHQDKKHFVGMEVYPNREVCVKIFNDGKLVDLLHRYYGFKFNNELTPIIPTEFYAFSDGDTYFGNFKDGKMHYFGKYVMSGGGNIVCQINKSDFEGVGTYFYADGRRYIGQFKASCYEGYGVMIDKNNKITIGIFKEDELIETLVKK